MKLDIVTLEGDNISIDKKIGCYRYVVPLKEVVGNRYSGTFKRWIPIHAMESFTLMQEFTVAYDRSYTVRGYLKSEGLTKETLKYKSERVGR